MSLDELSRTLDRSGDNGYAILLECMINQIATSRALMSVLVDHIVSGDDLEKRILFRRIEDQVAVIRDSVLRGLYEKYGHLPPDIEELLDSTD